MAKRHAPTYLSLLIGHSSTPLNEASLTISIRLILRCRRTTTSTLHLNFTYKQINLSLFVFAITCFLLGLLFTLFFLNDYTNVVVYLATKVNSIQPKTRLTSLLTDPENVYVLFYSKAYTGLN